MTRQYAEAGQPLIGLNYFDNLNISVNGYLSSIQNRVERTLHRLSFHV